MGSDELMKVTLDHVDTEVCKKLFAAETGGKQMAQGVIPSMMCAGVLEGGKDTCQVIIYNIGQCDSFFFRFFIDIFK